MKDGTGLQYFPSTSSGHRLTDHLGSVVAVTDSNGTLTSQQRYLPFGDVRTNVGAISQTDFGYTGQRDLGDELGLMDYRARFYSSALGRFTQPDSIIPNPSNPQGWNRYSYVLNSPVNFNDPSGHKPCWAGKRYKCDLDQKTVDREYGKYKDKDKSAVRAFFASQGFQVSQPAGDGWGGDGGLSMGGGIGGGRNAIANTLFAGNDPPSICVGPRWGNGDCVDIVQLVDDAFTSIGLDSVAEVLTGELKIGWDASLVPWEEVGMDVLGLIGDLIVTAELPVTYLEGAKALNYSIMGVEAYTDAWSFAQGKPDKINVGLNAVSIVPWFGATTSGIGLVYNLYKGFYLY